MEAPPTPSLDYGAVTQPMIAHLRGTRPWVLFIAVLGFIAAGFLVLAALAVSIAGSLSGELPPIAALGVGFAYMLGAIIYVVVSVLLLRFASAVARIGPGPGAAGPMEEALRHQKSFWRIVGILSIVYLVIMFLVLVFGIIAGVFASAMH